MNKADERPDPATLVDRLRGIYIIPVNDGAGLLNGKDTFTRVFPDRPPIQGEAANRIVELEEQLREVREYFDQRADADCDQDGFVGNVEMHHLSEIDQVLDKATK